MQEPATFNFSATAHVPGELVLTLDPPEEVDLAGCTVRAAVAMSGACVRLLDCSAVNPENIVAINFPGLSAGWAFYDVFLTFPGGAEMPLLKGEIDIAQRVTPADPQQRAEWYVTATLPGAETGRVEIILGQGPRGPQGRPGDKGEPGTLESNVGDVDIGGALTAESAAINGPLIAGMPDGTVSAGTCNQIYGITRFWQSLDVRDGGWWRGTIMYESGMLNIAQGASLNCIGPATVASTLNANGGINIPLAVGAPTATGGVNRLYASGLVGVTGLVALPAYLDTGAVTATGTAATTVLIPGQYAQTNVRAGTHSTIVHYFAGPKGQWNYSSFAGFAVPWQITNAGKLTALGGGQSWCGKI